MIKVLHLTDLPCPNPWLNGVAENHDRRRFRHLVATLGPRNPLHEALEARRSGPSRSTRRRAPWPLAVAG